MGFKGKKWTNSKKIRVNEIKSRYKIIFYKFLTICLTLKKMTQNGSKNCANSPFGYTEQRGEATPAKNKIKVRKGVYSPAK